MNFLRVLASVSGFTLLSRITGLVREMLVASIFGAGATTDAFFVAFRIPNLLRRLFAEGAFSQAFIPVLGQSKATHGEAQTKVLVDRTATLLFWVVTLITILGIVGVSGVMWVMAGTMEVGSERYEYTRIMTQIMFPYIIFMSLIALSSGILNTWKNFSTPAFTPVLLNIAMISASIFLAPHFNPPIYALTAGVIAGGILQLAWQIPALKRIGMLPKISFNIVEAARDPNVRRILKLMLPATLAVSVAQISLIINTNWAASLGNGAVSWISYADRLMEFPTGMLGVALGTILLPSLTRAHSANDHAEYERLLNWGLRLTLLLALPAAVGLGVLSIPLTSTLFQHGRFTAVDVQKTAQALSMYSFGLVGLISVKILASAYYAKQDIVTPVLIGIGVLVSTQLMNLLFVPYLQHAGLSLSIGLGACLNAAILVFLLGRRGVLGTWKPWLQFIAKVILAVLAMGVVAYFASRQIDWLSMSGGTALLKRAAWLTAIIVASAVCYFAALFVMGFRMRDFRLVSHA